MNGEKPKKTLYENQKEIIDFVTLYIHNNLSRHFSKIYIIGSLSEKKFGTYHEKYEGFFGSDIDLVVLPKQNMKKFKYKGEFRDWNEYNGGKIKIKNTEHPVNLMVPIRQDIKLLFKKAKEAKWKVIRLK